jgi:hypothetical protein
MGVVPFQSSTQLAGSSAAPHRLHDLRVFPSGLNEPQSPSFSRQTWQRDLARAENREFAGVLERGAGLKTERDRSRSEPHQSCKPQSVPIYPQQHISVLGSFLEAASLNFSPRLIRLIR